MFEQYFGKTAPQFDAALASAKQLNSLTIDTVEKLTAFQLDKARSYADLGLSQLRAALSVTSPQELQAYLSGQNKVAQELAGRVQADAKALAELGTSYGAEAQKLLRQQAGAATKPKAA